MVVPAGIPLDRTSRVLVVIPAYQEQGRVGRVVSGFRDQGFEVVVVDDCSTDRTAAEAAEAGARVIRLPIHLGYGAAVQTGHRYAQERGIDVVLQADGDGQHDPLDAWALIGPVLAGEADVVVGSRFLPDSPPYRMPWARRIGSRLFGGLAGLLTGRRILDPTSGYQALSRRVVELYCSDVFPEDYPDADMFVLLARLGLKTTEIPARMFANENGASMHRGWLKVFYYIYKMSLAIFVAAVRDLDRWRKP